MARDTDKRFDQLYPRQLQCLRMTYDRKTSKEIAAAMGIGPGTVDGYIADAVRTIGARNRRDAAEQLHFYELNAPDNSGDGFPGVAAPTHQPSVEERPAASLRRLLPLRQKDALRNDLTVFQRLAWIPGLALAGAVGFGALASGLRVVSDLVADLIRAAQ